MEPYLLRLGERLVSGLAGMPPETQVRHRQFILRQQNPDGGFSGREGGSDLYYTGFAVRGLSLLGGLEGSECARLAEYLASQSRAQLTVIDLVSWLYSSLMVQTWSGTDVLAGFATDWPTRLAEIFESFRTRDGGYAKTHEGAAGSTYHSFLITTCYELIGQQQPHPKRLIQFVYDRQREDGGFVEIAPMKRSGTNPTAAAVAILKILGGLDEELKADILAFLQEARSSEGGFQANTRVPFADSLSTFTGLLTLQDLNGPSLISTAALNGFINQLESPDGGFRGALWDQGTDVEYTFYALGVRGLAGTGAT